MTSRRDFIREKVMQRVAVDPRSGCWTWQGPTSGSSGRGAGYPRMNLNNTTVAVHLVMWTNEHGLIPHKKQIDHQCRNRLCVNPDHLEMVTHKQTQKRRDQALRGSAQGASA